VFACGGGREGGRGRGRGRATREREREEAEEVVAVAKSDGGESGGGQQNNT
jgi:hypothetical protein